MTRAGDRGDGELAQVRRRLAEFAHSYADLPLYARLAAAAAADDEVAVLLTHARPGQARPALLLAAIHELVLRRPELPAARWYASVVERHRVPQAGDPWPQVREAVLDHRDELVETIATHTTQTNEVNRAAYLAPLLAAATADLADRPVALVELGASAGLLLVLDRYATVLTDADDGHPVCSYGDPASTVRCAGVLRGEPPAPGLRLPPGHWRRGVDLHPARLDDPIALRWLRACLWPDVPGRVERFAAAVEVARTHPPRVDEGDFVDDLPQVLGDAAAESPEGTHVVVVTSWALTYAARPRREAVVAALARHARTAGALTLLTAEPPGTVPGLPEPTAWPEPGRTTVLGLRRWRGGAEQPGEVWGVAHPHGDWVARLPPRGRGGGGAPGGPQ